MVSRSWTDSFRFIGFKWISSSASDFIRDDWKLVAFWQATQHGRPGCLLPVTYGLTAAHQAVIFVSEGAHHSGHVLLRLLLFFLLRFLAGAGRGWWRGGGRCGSLLELPFIYGELDGIRRGLGAQVIHARLEALKQNTTVRNYPVREQQRESTLTSRPHRTARKMDISIICFCCTVYKHPPTVVSIYLFIFGAAWCRRNVTLTHSECMRGKVLWKQIPQQPTVAETIFSSNRNCTGN